ncbi:MAG TPA: hypothetical protein HA326_02535 [Thermoplasmata archaeon]|nr:hypothetical protein [Thermoplasmata archaeon]
MAFEHLVLAAAKTVVLALGLTISGWSFLAYRRRGDRLMLGLAVAFGLVAVGSFLEGFLFEILNWDLLTVHLVESVFVFTGLATIAFLLRPRGART